MMRPTRRTRQVAAISVMLFAVAALTACADAFDADPLAPVIREVHYVADRLIMMIKDLYRTPTNELPAGMENFFTRARACIEQRVFYTGYGMSYQLTDAYSRALECTTMLPGTVQFFLCQKPLDLNMHEVRLLMRILLECNADPEDRMAKLLRLKPGH